MRMEAKNFYHNTPLENYEPVWIHEIMFTEKFILKCHLQRKIQKFYFYAELQNLM